MTVDITWKCHVCHRERPDRLISVHTKELEGFPKGEIKANQNIRYCNDNEECYLGAIEHNIYDLMKGIHKEVAIRGIEK